VRGIVWTGELEVRDDVELRDPQPGPGEVLVRVERAGVCHSDLSVVNGTIPFPTPVVLGHEGAGVVEAVGPGVRKVAEGDHVVLTFEAACLIGCAVVTGTGAVLNRAKVRPGETVVVIGVGGIGLSVVQAARIAAAGRIVAIDANPAKEAVAKQFGATEFILASNGASAAEDTVAAVKDLGLPNGVDHVFECVGHPALIRQSIDLLDWGGNCVLLGVPKLGTEATFVVNSMYNDKAIMGCRYGTTRPHHDIPLLVSFYLDGRLQLDEMVSQVYDLGDIQQALDDMHDGKVNRGVLRVASA
jgi:Zn-dependent alcohol dehydrogenase